MVGFLKMGIQYNPWLTELGSTETRIIKNYAKKNTVNHGNNSRHLWAMASGWRLLMKRWQDKTLGVTQEAMKNITELFWTSNSKCYKCNYNFNKQHKCRLQKKIRTVMIIQNTVASDAHGLTGKKLSETPWTLFSSVSRGRSVMDIYKLLRIRWHFWIN